MVQIDFNVLGERQVSRMLSRTTDKAADLGPYWQMVQGLLEESVGKQFDTQGGRTGGWAPLSARYAADKSRRFGSQPILVATGALKESLTGGSGGIARQEGNTSLRFGTQLGYGRFHQTGTSNMPQRRILDLTNDDRRTMMKMLQRHLFT